MVKFLERYLKKFGFKDHCGPLINNFVISFLVLNLHSQKKRLKFIKEKKKKIKENFLMFDFIVENIKKKINIIKISLKNCRF